MHNAVENILKNLDRLLQLSFSHIPQKQKIGVLFSAGVDSSLIAKYAKDLGLKPALFTFGTEFSKDKEFAQRLTQDLELPFNYLYLDKDEIENAIPEVKKILISARVDPNLMQISLSIGFYKIAQLAKTKGITLFLSGQGSDELFGGYNKYLTLNIKDLKIRMEEDIKNLFKVDVVRDRAMTGQFGINIYFPYLDKEFLEYAQGLPVKLKIRTVRKKSSWSEAIGSHSFRWDSIARSPKSNSLQNDNQYLVRKWILRELAREKGLPDYIFNRPKNALQYSSGIQKIVEKLLKNKNSL